jgi:1-acyl-sn-glycerol-3-phosphate acyltransferase
VTGTQRLHRRDDPARQSIPLALARLLAKAIVRLYFRVDMRGLEHLPKTGPVLIAGNHTGWLDGPLVQMLLPRPTAFLVKAELYDGPARPFLEFSRQIPIRRGAPDRTALHRAVAVLAGGGVLGVFPEGTRGVGKLQSVQHGIGYIALRAQIPGAECPIIPVVCTGTAEALPKGAKFPKFRAPISIVFGPTFTLDVHGDPRARSTVAAATEQIRQRLLGHLESVEQERPAA